MFWRNSERKEELSLKQYGVHRMLTKVQRHYVPFNSCSKPSASPWRSKALRAVQRFKGSSRSVAEIPTVASGGCSKVPKFQGFAVPNACGVPKFQGFAVPGSRLCPYFQFDPLFILSISLSFRRSMVLVFICCY